MPYFEKKARTGRKRDGAYGEKPHNDDGNVFEAVSRRLTSRE